MRQAKQKTFRTTLVVTGIIIASKLLGFVREMVMAAYFGRGIESDAYVTAYGILSLFTLLFTAGISSTFIPIYTRLRLRSGDKGANRYASNVLSLYCVAGLLTSVVAYLVAPWLAGLVYQGSAEGVALATELSRLMYPTIAFWAMTGVLCNVLNAREKFIPEQLLGFVLSACLITACVVFKEIHAVAIAVAVMAVIQFLILLPFLRGEFHYYPGIRLGDASLKRTFLLAIPALISMAFDEINHTVDRMVGSSLGLGVVTSLNKSYSLVATVLGVLIVPITTIMFSRLSKFAARGDRKTFMKTVRQSLETIALVTLPVIAVCMVMSKDIIAIAFQRGQFTAEDTAFTAPVFAFYIMGVIFFGMRNFLTRVYYSIQNTRTPMRVGIVAVCINIALNLTLSRFLGAVGLTLATTIASACGLMLQLFFLHRQLGRMGLRKSIGQMLRMAVALAVGVGLMMLCLQVLPVHTGDTVGSLIRLVICAAVCLVSYFLLCIFLRVEGTHMLLRVVFRKQLHQAHEERQRTLPPTRRTETRARSRRDRRR